MVKEVPGYFSATMWAQDEGTTPISVLFALIPIYMEEKGKQSQDPCNHKLIWLYMAHVVNHRDLREKCFNDKYLDEWEITMKGSRALQSLSCWTLSRAAIPFPPNTGLSNSTGIASNNKVSILLVWSQAANPGGREGKVLSGTSAISNSWPFLADIGIIRWKWRSTQRHLKNPQLPRKKIMQHYRIPLCPWCLCFFPSFDRLNGSVFMSGKWGTSIVHTENSR